MGASAGNRRSGFCTWDLIKRLVMRKPNASTRSNTLGIIEEITTESMAHGDFDKWLSKNHPQWNENTLKRGKGR